MVWRPFKRTSGGERSHMQCQGHNGRYIKFQYLYLSSQVERWHDIKSFRSNTSDQFWQSEKRRMFVHVSHQCKHTSFDVQMSRLTYTASLFTA